MGDMTNQLISLAKAVHPNPPMREYDMLVSVGERISISLLAMALARIGKEAVSFTGSQSGIITTKEHCEAKIIDVRPKRLNAHLELGKCVIVAGFQGVSEQKEITTLGRGGSDTTAVALGLSLSAEKVEFYKDVTHLFDADPKKCLTASPFKSISYEKALEIVRKTGGQILHPRAIKLAEKNKMPLHIRSFCNDNENGTRIFDENSTCQTNSIYER